MTEIPTTALQLRSLVDADGTLELSLQTVDVPTPGDGQVLVRVEAAPLNPSDLGLLFAGADMSTAVFAGAGDASTVSATVPPAALRALAGRVGDSLPVGNEGAGTVVAAGSSDAAQALLGKTVAVLGGAMYSQYRCVDVAQCLELPDGVTAVEGASCFVNPLTVLGLVGTMRREGHTALVHTAAASNLGQMLNRLCLADGIGLVNIVRSPEQETLLRSAGAEHVCNSTAPSFTDDLTAALVATGATIAFDAIGGGRLAGQILDVHGGGAGGVGGGVQPVRLDDPQAGVHLRRARSWSDRAQPQLRDGVEHRRLAAHALHAARRCRGGRAHAPARRHRDHDHVRQLLHQAPRARRGAQRRRRRRLRQAGDGREVPHHPERLTRAPRLDRVRVGQ